MLKHAIPPARFFTQVSNDIIRHPRLSAEAVRLLTWQLSLPDDADQPLSETAKRAGIKKTAFQRAKQELIAEGYVHEWRGQGPGGRWATRQLVSNVPLSEEEALAVRDGGDSPTAVEPAVGEPEAPSVGRSQENTEENTHNPPSQPSPPSLPSRLIERGAQALASVSHRERQLRLTGREVAELAPLAAEWFLRGATLTDLREALTSGLPERVHAAAALARNRLTRKMPLAPSFAEQRNQEAPAAEPRVASMRECRGDHVQPLLFRPVAGEALCPPCRRERAETAAATGVPDTARAAATVRAALRDGVRPPRPCASG